MRNEIFYPNDPNDKLSLPVAADKQSGDFVLVGDQGMYGVLATDEGEGGNPDGYASVWLAGTFDLPITTTTAADIGDKVYAVPANGNLTPVSTSNIHVGWFVEAKGTTAGEVVRVRLAKL